MTATVITIRGFELHVIGAAPTDTGITSELLAAKLGYAKRQQLEELAGRHAPYLAQFGQVLTVSIQQQAPGQVAPRTVQMPIYNRDQAHYLIAKSQQPTANELTVALLLAFRELEALVSRPAASPDMGLFIATMEKLIGGIARRLDALEGAVVSPARGADLRHRMLVLARLRVEAGFEATQASALRVVQNKLGAALGHSGKGNGWDRLPAAKLPEALRMLGELEAEARRAIQLRKAARQSELPFEGGVVH